MLYVWKSTDFLRGNMLASEIIKDLKTKNRIMFALIVLLTLFLICKGEK